MDLYCLISYMLLCVALTLSLFSFTRKIFALNNIVKFIICVIVGTLSLVHFGHYSLANLLYSVFDLPSFLLTLVCFISIIRAFSDKFEIFISLRGAAFLCVMWGIFVLNTIGIFDWYYGSINYKILIICIFISIAYCIDRVCGALMLICFCVWIIFANFIDVYHAVFDPLICLFCPIIQGVPRTKDRFHIALLRPKVKNARV